MLRKIFIALLLLLALEAALLVGLFQWIGVWSIPVLIVANAAVVPFAGKWLFKKALMAPFKLKGAVLRGATATVSSVEPAPAPPRDADDESAPGPRDHFYLDVTVVPQQTAGPFRSWDPNELVLVRPDAKPEPDDDEVGSVEEVRFWDGAAWVEELPDDYAGDQRVRLLVSVAPGTRRAKFRYYFELFGDVTFPTAAAAAR